MILVMSVSGILFALGGTEIPTTGRGYKWLRRFVMPVFLAGIALLYAPWWACVGYGLTTSVALHMGYGDRCSWLKRAFIFISYGVTSLWFGFSWWIAITPALLALLFLASNWKPLASTVFWKSWEFLAGVLIALCFIGVLLNKW